MKIPERILRSLNAYVRERRPVGGFLYAVLTNDLVETLHRADEESLAALTELVRHVWGEIPLLCWGSPEKVARWLEKERGVSDER